MATDYGDLSALDAATTAAARAEAVGRLEDLLPGVRFAQGAVADLVVNPGALLAAAHAAAVDGYRTARSLADIVADPDAADEEGVDAVLSNFRVARKPANAAYGTVRLRVNSPSLSYVLGVGWRLRANGAWFRSVSSYAVGTVANAGSLVPAPLRSEADGSWSFAIAVAAEEAGAAGRLRDGQELEPEEPFASFRSAHAEGAFAGGEARESNAALLARLRRGVAARVPTYPAGADAWLRDQTGWEDTPRLLVLAASNPAQLRNRRGLLPVPAGGRVDWLLRSDAAIVSWTVSAAARCEETVAAGRTRWRVTLEAAAAAGAYEPAGVVDEGGAALGSFSWTRRWLSAATAADPDVRSAAEAYGSSRQAFDLDVELLTAAANGATRTVSVTLRGQRRVLELQQLLASADFPSWGGDVLARAVLPCEAWATIHVAGDLEPTDVERAAAAAAVQELADELEPGQPLYASDIMLRVALALPGQKLRSVALTARVGYPDGTNTALASLESVVPPHDPARGVSAATMAIFCPADHVHVAWRPA